MSDSARCPFCGKLLKDLWDYNWGDREELRDDCGHCGKAICIVRRVSVSYEVLPDKAEEKK